MTTPRMDRFIEAIHRATDRGDGITLGKGLIKIIFDEYLPAIITDAKNEEIKLTIGWLKGRIPLCTGEAVTQSNISIDALAKRLEHGGKTHPYFPETLQEIEAAAEKREVERFRSWWNVAGTQAYHISDEDIKRFEEWKVLGGAWVTLRDGETEVRKF